MFFPDFLPQAAHVDGESVVIYIISTAVPQSAQKDIPGHHALLVQQGQQQPKLRGGQGQGGPVPGDASRDPARKGSSPSRRSSTRMRLNSSWIRKGLVT